MAQKLLILGSGGHGREVADAALESGWGHIAFLDDGNVIESLGLPVLGPLSDLPNHAGGGWALALGIDDADLRMSLLQQATSLGFFLPVIRHPSVIMSRFASAGAGTVLLAGAILRTGARLGKGCIVGTAASVGHDCHLHNGVHLASGVHLSGGTVLEENVTFGVGAVSERGVRVGARTVVGAGAAVVRDLPAAPAEQAKAEGAEQ